MVVISSVNLNERRIFPEEKYTLQVRSCDSTPPHFHVISKEEGYDIRLLASTGKLIYVDQYGKRSPNDKFTDVVRQAKEWLQNKPAHPRAAASKTNKEHIEFVWEQNHNYYIE